MSRGVKCWNLSETWSKKTFKRTVQMPSQRQGCVGNQKTEVSSTQSMIQFLELHKMATLWLTTVGVSLGRMDFFPLVQLFLIDVAPIATLQNSVSKPAARDQRNSSISHSLQLNNAIMTSAKGARGPHPKQECSKPYGAISGYHLGSA